MLDVDTQNMLLKKCQLGDIEARNKLAESYFPMINMFAYKYHKNHKHIDVEDLIQDGQMEIMSILPKCDLSRSRISTFVHNCLSNFYNDTVYRSCYNSKASFSMPIAASRDLKKISLSEPNNITPKQRIILENVACNRVNIDNAEPQLKEDDQLTMEKIRNIAEKTLDNQEFVLFNMWAGFDREPMKISKIARAVDAKRYHVDRIIKNASTKMRKVLKEYE